MPKRIGAGSEVDAYCTKCRMDLGHRVVAMLGDRPARVECQTCGSHHNYRPAASAKEKSRLIARPETAKPTKAQRTSQVVKAEAERRTEWERRILGQAATAFTRFTVNAKFRPDQLVTHKKFGEGYVVELLEDDKLTIMFADGAKTLVHGKA